MYSDETRINTTCHLFIDESSSCEYSPVSPSEGSHSQLKQFPDVEMQNSSIMTDSNMLTLALDNMDSVEKVTDECKESIPNSPKKADENMKQSALALHGYVYHKNIASTLQGQILEAVNTHTHSIVVVKKAMKNLVNSNCTFRHGRVIKIEENIRREIEIMSYLSASDVIPCEHIQLIDLFEDKDSIYVVTEHGGVDFFKWIVAAHEKIANGELNMRYWWKNIKFLFKQMVKYVLWLHEMGVCHLDLSLENLLLKDGEYFYQKGKFTRSQQIKVCDFGLAEYFDRSNNPSFACTKHVGKESYMAPEVYSKTQSFDARQADSWSLGVILFIMMSGAPAYSMPISTDKTFQYIISQKIPHLLNSWGRLHYIDPLMLDLLQKIFVLDPKKRYTVQQIRDHKWLQ